MTPAPTTQTSEWAARSAGSAGTGTAARLQVGPGGESERAGWLIAPRPRPASPGQERADAGRLGRAQDRLGEDEIGKPYAQVRHQDPASGPRGVPARIASPSGRVGVWVAVEEARVAVREQLGAIVGEEQGASSATSAAIEVA